ncbi:MAG: hypothetical protein KBH14_00770 [Vicinamibacteria bacterium]|jgi:hypothetical protein|nr:hypothetical protein [Vicinamibacteria bacterium]
MRPRLSLPLLGVASATALLVLVGPESAFAQCAMCRDAVASSSSETRTAMNYAIVGLALTPYGVAAMAAWSLSPTVRAWTSRTLRRLTFNRTENDQ